MLKRSSSDHTSADSRPIEHFTKSLNLIATTEDVLNKYDSADDSHVIPQEQDDPFIPAPIDDAVETLDHYELLSSEQEKTSKIIYPMFVPRKRKKYFNSNVCISCLTL